MPNWLRHALEYVLNFSNVLNTSISASWLVLAIVLLRLLLKKAPKRTHVALWGLVAVRLMLPFSIESAFSLIPSAQTVPEEILQYEGAQLQENAYLNVISNPVFSGDVSVALEQTVDRVQVRMVAMTHIWLAGMAILLLYTAISCWRLHRMVGTAVRCRDNIYQSEHVSSPFVFGIMQPKIYLPFKMHAHDMEHVVAHEQAHIRRKDHWWKPLGFLLLTIHWFNPLMWLGYVLLCRDIELACDERVIRELDNKGRADYTQALVACSVNRRMVAACPLAFGEVGIRERIRSVLNYQKPSRWVAALSVIVCAFLAVCFLTDPAKAAQIPEPENDHEEISTEDTTRPAKDLSNIPLTDEAILAEIEHLKETIAEHKEMMERLQKQYETTEKRKRLPLKNTIETMQEVIPQLEERLQLMKDQIGME